jgi:hypothetical protein
MLEKLDIIMLVNVLTRVIRSHCMFESNANSWKLCLVFFFQGQKNHEYGNTNSKIWQNFLFFYKWVIKICNQFIIIIIITITIFWGMCCHNIGYDFNDNVHKCHQLNQFQHAHHCGYITQLEKIIIKKKLVIIPRILPFSCNWIKTCRTIL